MKWIQELFKPGKQQIAPIYYGPLVQLHAPDVESIYHHLHPGTEVELRLEHQDELNAQVVAYFKQFRLGCIPRTHTPVVEQLLSRGFFLKTQIAQIVKEKYLPTQGLSISVTDQFTKA